MDRTLAPALERYPYGRVSVICATVSCLAWVGSGLAPRFPATVGLFGLAWVPIGATNVLFFALLQRVVPAALLGRVNSVLYSVSTVVLPLGFLAGGGAVPAS